MGAYEVSIGDTIGVGTAGKTAALFALVAERVPVGALAGHFHDTYGQALTNVYAAMEMGVATFDCSVAGLGGCPYAKGATGNVASEDVVYLMNGLGIETGVDLDALRAAGEAISKVLGRPPVSRVARALAAKSPLPAHERREPAREPAEQVPSPCISVCVMDADGSVCLGCFRTLDEIAAWSVARRERQASGAGGAAGAQGGAASR